jgi:hypothetical protein
MGNVIGGLLGTNKPINVGREMQAVAGMYARPAQFVPYSIRSSLGTTHYSPETGIQTNLSAPYQGIVGTTVGGAQNLFEQAAAFDPSRRAAQVFSEQSALLQPEFQRQATDLQSRLFGSGRLGLRLAGESQGLGTGSGMVQPDALGLGRAQQQTLAQLAAGARQQAFGEQAQLQQAASGMLQAGMGVEQMGQNLTQLGFQSEAERARAAYQAGLIGTSYFDPQMSAYNQRAKSQTGFIGGMFGSIPGLSGFAPR